MSTSPINDDTAAEPSAHISSDNAEEVSPRSRHEAVALTSAPLPQRRAGLFGLKKNYGRQTNLAGLSPYDYEAKYAEDAYGEECGPDARVWHVYLDEAGRFDWEKIGDWKDNIDITLVFAGLFSAIVTAFVLESLQNLKSDDTPLLLIELISIQRAVAQSASVADIPSTATAFVQSQRDIWVNGLWFFSLGLSVSTAFLAMLIKQWLQKYLATATSANSPRDQSRLRQFRSTGLDIWKVDVILEFLPIIMYIAVASFLLGLIFFLHALHPVIATVLAVISGTTSLFYLATSVLSVIYPQCPYKTPLNSYIYTSLHPGTYLRGILNTPKRAAIIVSRLRSIRVGPFPFELSTRNILSSVHYFLNLDKLRHWARVNAHRTSSLSQFEYAAIGDQAPDLDAGAIRWLLKQSSHHSGSSIAFQAIGGLFDGADVKLGTSLYFTLGRYTQWTAQEEPGAKRRMRTVYTSNLVHYIRYTKDVRHMRDLTDDATPEPTFEGHHHLHHLLPFIRGERSGLEFVRCVSCYLFGENAAVPLPQRVWTALLDAVCLSSLTFPPPNETKRLTSAIAASLSSLVIPTNAEIQRSYSLFVTNLRSGGLTTLRGAVAGSQRRSGRAALVCLYRLMHIIPPSPEDTSEKRAEAAVALCRKLLHDTSGGKRFTSIVMTMHGFTARIQNLSPLRPERHRLTSTLCSVLMEFIAELPSHPDGSIFDLSPVLFNCLWDTLRLLGGPAATVSHVLMPSNIARFSGWLVEPEASGWSLDLTRQHANMCEGIYNAIAILLAHQSAHPTDQMAVLRACSDPETLSSLSSSSVTKGHPWLASEHSMVIQAYIQSLVKFGTMPLEDVKTIEGKELADKLHSHPDTLMNICKILIAAGYDSDFGELLHLRADHVVWNDKAQELRDWITASIALESRRDVFLNMLDDRHNELSPTVPHGKIWRGLNPRSWLRKAPDEVV